MPQGKAKFGSKPGMSGMKKAQGKASKPLRQVRKGAPKKAKVVKESHRLQKEVEKYIRQKNEKEIRKKAGDEDYKKDKK